MAKYEKKVDIVWENISVEQIIKSAIFLSGVFLLFSGVAFLMKADLAANNTVKGRELPIYCVETQEKKVALSFDAAWGNEDTKDILDILKKQDVHVTFFMTGGWVEAYPDVVKTAQKLGYFTIQWDVESLDWKDYGVDSIIKTVTEHKHLGNGSIILCHNGAKYTAQALEPMIVKLKELGYEIVPVSELIYKEKYHLNHEGRQIPD